jgi:putative pyruvate formate lyase activating enzyme
MRTEIAEAGYLSLYRTGELGRRVKQLYLLEEKCHLCPRKCGALRLNGEHEGVCGAGRVLKISSHNLHFGEEPPISGSNGSGTIFFTNCNLHCVFCQNYPISNLGNGRNVTEEGLAKMMLELQEEGAHNINLVTPTHYVPQILEALGMAIGQGLHIPLVYNSGGYESIETLRLLDGIIDIYMPDAKYWSSELAERYSHAADYPEVNRSALKEMYRQVGDLTLDSHGIAIRGLLVRHLVLPGAVEDTKKILEFLAMEISPQVYISLMSQYHPCYNAFKYPDLSRRLTTEEYDTARVYADHFGLTNGWCQIE